MVFKIKQYIICIFCLLPIFSEIIVAPVAVIRNDFGEFAAQFSIDNMINQTNNLVDFNSGVDDFDDFAALNPTATSNNVATQFFGENNNVGPIIDFDLGELFQISQLGLFNNQNRGFEDVDIFTATQADFSDAIFVGNFTFALSGDAAQDSPFEVRNLGNNIGQFVRFDVNSFGTNILGGKQITFGVNAASVPEPSVYLLLAFLLFLVFIKKNASPKPEKIKL
ncbi:PEP-CTERM sorting domain-containing protein [Candidatus Uabimicrobium sp. HlEnr_7]|uniref:PEP-CTERM sorting domain-containing protein n=1 Tax=Candidatus Uabimicrobium helgolandensis TaxID=3095367 RepID=UPI003555BE86